MFNDYKTIVKENTKAKLLILRCLKIILKNISQKLKMVIK